MIRGLLFDLDGTLVDSERETVAAVDDALRAAGLAPQSLDVGQLGGRTWQDILGLLRARDPGAAAIDELALVDAWLDRVRRDGRPIPGAEAFLRTAAARAPVAIVSSSPRRAIRELLPRGLDLPMVGGDDVARGKPDPEPYRRGAALLQLEPSACLVFEDSVAGLESARAAGCATMAILCAAAAPERCRALADRSVEDFVGLEPEDLLAAGR